MYEKLKECPVCSSDNITNHSVIKDHSVSKESFVIMLCDNCNFQFTNPRPDHSQIARFYQSQNYISHTNKGNNPINLLYKIVRNYSTAQKIKLIKTITNRKNGKIFDYGIGTGYFLKAIEQAGWRVTGLEPDTAARNLAEKSTGITIHSDLSKIIDNNEKFDLITLWHVLEHVHDVNEVFIKLKTLLKEKGKMLIAVPNVDSFDNNLFQEHWAAYDVPRHLYHFNQESMKTFVMKHGMKVKKVHPMKFDSFYISMLSNKYKTGSSNLLKSLITGLQSNHYAKQHKNNYSSIIFEIRK
ncbi:MAG: 2-polyprenyl-3-methyl-5-hydroxy-6-metoxy-1,4-benzoquinol methylase [Marivirga sp.]|jgi:2-polyprenyl-3-methyl-5-hydroxy-6-metoxy-1,4-benzoquinol methylase